MQSLFGAEIFFHISVLEYFPEWYVENISWTWNPLVITFEEEKLSRVSCIQNESTIISVFQNISVGKEERKPSCRKG